MTRYILSARLLAPVMVQKKRQTNTPSTMEYLPGSTLRGALAGSYLRTGGSSDDPSFELLFNANQGVRFPSLLPAVAPTEIPAPLPDTALSCKRHSGFLSTNEHGVRDSLTLLAHSRLHGPVPPELWECRKCQNDLKPFSGFWNGNTTDPALRQVTLLVQRHTGIDRITGTVADGIFYTSQTMSDMAGQDQQLLNGTVFLTDQQGELLDDLLARGPVFAGADRTRGLGELVIERSVAPKRDLDAATWSAAFARKYAGETGSTLPDGIYFSLALQSDAILVDAFLRPAIKFLPDFDDIEPVGRTVRQTVIRGWQSAWGLPKPEDVGMAMGGVMLFRYTGTDIHDLNAYLHRLEGTGIGLRREEGFGAVRICDPIHLMEAL